MEGRHRLPNWPIPVAWGWWDTPPEKKTDGIPHRMLKLDQASEKMLMIKEQMEQNRPTVAVEMLDPAHLDRIPVTKCSVCFKPQYCGLLQPLLSERRSSDYWIYCGICSVGLGIRGGSMLRAHEHVRKYIRELPSSKCLGKYSCRDNFPTVVIV